MKVTTETIEKSRVVLNIQVEPEEMEEAVKKAYSRLAAKASVPGFRKGKAPVAVLERYYGKQALVEDAAENLLPEVYEKALREHEVPAIAQPEVEVIQIDPLSFKATVPVRPTVELGDYHGLKLEQDKVEVSDEEVSKALEGIRYSKAPWEPVERPAQQDDLLSIDVQGTVGEEKVFDEKGGWYQLSPQEPSGIPGFGENLQGAQKGETREFTLTLPEGRGEFGGRECQFKVTVHEIKQKSLPELNDEFAKSLGENIESLEALRERIATEFKIRKEQEARSKLEEEAIEALVGLARVEYPEVLVEQEMDRLAAEREQFLSERRDLKEYVANLKKSDEELREELRPTAEKLVVRSLILNKFAQLEGVDVDSGEVDSEVEHMIGHASDEKIRNLLDTPAAKESVRRGLFSRKTMDHLINIVTSDEEPVPASDDESVDLKEESEISSKNAEVEEDGTKTE